MSPDERPGPPRWLAWSREIQALGQIVRTYARSEYDRQNARRLTEIAAEIAQEHSQLGAQELAGRFEAQIGYATPKVDVRGAVVREGRILLVKEAQDGRWCMPGGWADVGQAPSRMIVREVEEESGLRVRPVRVVGVYDANRGGRPLAMFHAYKLVALCEDLGGEPRPSHETLEVAFFDFDELPPLSSHRTSARHLADVRAALADPLRPTALD